VFPREGVKETLFRVGPPDWSLAPAGATGAAVTPAPPDWTPAARVFAKEASGRRVETSATRAASEGRGRIFMKIM
jgi:hypothetical protein